MALSLLPESNGQRAELETEGCRWELHGHDAEILGVATRGSVFASSSIDGLILLWRLRDQNIENVCKMSTKGPAVTDVAFLEPGTLAGAQADCTVGVWDVETGRQMRSLSRMKVVERSSWPVINTLCARDHHLLFFGGDDGYLVRHDASEGGAACTWANLKMPIASLLVQGDSLFVGDVCGVVHWYDIRSTTKKISSIQCGSDVISSLGALSEEQIVAYSMDSKATVIDVQPFVLEDGERLLSTVDMRQGGGRTLKRCAALPRRDMVAFATADATVSCAQGSALYKGITRTYTCGRANAASVNAVASLTDDYLVCGGDNALSVIAL